MPPMHHYLHSATGSSKSHAWNGKSTFILCTEYRIFLHPFLQKGNHSICFSICFSIQWPLDNSGTEVGVDGAE